MKNTNGGLTLIELLVVIGLIAVLMAILSSAMWKVRQNARVNRTMVDMRSMAHAIRNYRMEYEIWPGGDTNSGLTANRTWNSANLNSPDNNRHLIKWLVSSNPIAPYPVLNKKGYPFWETERADLQFLDSWMSPIAITIDITNNAIYLTSSGPDRNSSTVRDNLECRDE